MIDGCPENGPAVALAGADVHVVWPTVVGGDGGAAPTMAVFHAFTRDRRTFSARDRLPTQGQTPKHPRVATLTDGSVAAVWDEGQGGQRRVVVARRAARGATAFDRTVVQDPAFAQYPALAAVPGGGLVVAWASGVADHTVIRVARLGR